MCGQEGCIARSLSRSQQAEKRTGWREETGGGDVAASDVESPEESHSYLRRFSNADSHLRPVLHVETVRMSIKLLKNTTTNAQVMPNRPQSTFRLQSVLSNTRLNAARIRPEGLLRGGRTQNSTNVLLVVTDLIRPLLHRSTPLTLNTLFSHSSFRSEPLTRTLTPLFIHAARHFYIFTQNKCEDRTLGEKLFC